MAVDTLIGKIQSLPRDKVAEIEDLVDFLREKDGRSTGANTKLSLDVFTEIWDNAEDAVYDEL